MHRDRGVDLRTGVAVTGVFGESRVAGLTLSDGSQVDADVVVVGIGVTPNTEWLEGSGLTLDNGIVCDGTGEAAPDVYAAGDVARVANRLARRFAAHRALDQRRGAGGACGGECARRPGGRDELLVGAVLLVGPVRPQNPVHRPRPAARRDAIVDGSLEDRQLTALYRLGDRVVACLAVNQPRALIKYRKLLAGGVDWDTAIAAASS